VPEHEPISTFSDAFARCTQRVTESWAADAYTTICSRKASDAARTASAG
jgi:hypothetical protein